MRQEVVQEAVKSSPAVVISGWAWVTGLSISDAVGLATLLYIALQALYLLWKWSREWKRRNK